VVIKAAVNTILHTAIGIWS